MRPRPTSPTLLWSPPWQWCPTGAEGTAIMGTQSFFVVLSILLTAGVRRPRNLPEVMGNWLPACTGRRFAITLSPGPQLCCAARGARARRRRSQLGTQQSNLLVLHLVRTPCPVLPRFPMFCMPLRSYSSVTSSTAVRQLEPNTACPRRPCRRVVRTPLRGAAVMSTARLGPTGSQR